MKRSIGMRWVAIFVVILSTSVANAKVHVERGIYYPKLCKNMDEAKTKITGILNDKCVTIFDSTKIKIKYKSASVFDDRIELILKAGKKIMYFKDLFGDYNIKVNTKYTTYIDDATGKNNRDDYYDQITGLRDISIEKNDSAFFGVKFHDASQFPMCNKELADALFFIQQKVNKEKHDSLLSAFKPVAEQYLSLKVKPAISEEQRKYIVQANFFDQQKDYEKAISLYEKVTGIDQTAYPAAYYNLALLFAQVNNFNTAIFYMQEYLLLEPEAQDARAAQDKIYEWEAEINK